MIDTNLPLPAWIWHPEKERRLKTKLHRRFRLDKDIEDPILGIALTGRANVLIDGTEVLTLPETPENVCRFNYARSAPLKAGDHYIEIDIECQKPMPKHPAISFAYDRTVGCIAWLESGNFRLVTDSKWSADDRMAVEICKLGQEPYGDLDHPPGDFVRGGFGDLSAEPIMFDLMIADGTLFRQQDELLRLSGNIISSASIKPERHDELVSIYHLRKQEDWKRLRKIQKETNLNGVPNVLLDLRRESNARLKVRNLNSEPVTILWNGAESLFELENYDGCITEVVEIGPNETFFAVPAGMRYVKIFIMGRAGSQFRIEVSCESVGFPLQQVGTFWCDDEQLNRIYETSVHTNRLCHQLALWDGIKRDRLPWVYDLYLAARGAYPLWNDFSIIKRSLIELGHTPDGEWMNGMPSYTLWWFSAIWEYLLHRSDPSLAEELAEDIQRHADWVGQNVDDNGFLRVKESFIDWVPMSAQESFLSLQAIYVIAKQALTNISSVCPDLGLTFNWPLPEISQEQFLNSSAVITKVLGILAGYVNREGAIEFLRNYQLMDPISPSSAYLLACLYADFDMPEKGLSIIRSIWGGMLDQGATSFWEAVRCEYPEDFHKHLTTYTAYGEYRMSLCHAWSSTPVEWLRSVLLGVNPIEPGYRKVEIAIWAPENIRKCEGTVPTPFGPISVSWVRRRDGQIIVKTNVPESVQIV